MGPSNFQVNHHMMLRKEKLVNLILVLTGSKLIILHASKSFGLKFMKITGTAGQMIKNVFGHEIKNFMFNI